ncbi:MAG: ankyrin repeat domain-containing protein [Elusimicrobia bacterium]|nr:ankyrin repeat domain-containing protein [Elusimicrobiota bacterium]
MKLERKRQEGLAAFIAAALRGDIEQARAMLKGRLQFLPEDKEIGETPLHRAAARGDVRLAAALLACGADINAKTRYQEKIVHDYDESRGEETPLHYAVNHRRPRAVELLLKSKADPRARDIWGETPLHCAVRSKSPRMLALFRPEVKPQHKGDAFSPLHLAALNNDLKTVAWLLDHGADPNADGGDGCTPLFNVVSTRVAGLLIRRGARVNIKMKGGESPLHGAARSGHAALVRLLLRHNADPNAADKRGKTPLHAAAWRGQEAVARILVAAGGRPKAKDNAGKTPAYYAEKNSVFANFVLQGHKDTASFLRRVGGTTSGP